MKVHTLYSSRNLLAGVGAVAFVGGIVVLGERTIRTVGGKITRLTPSRSYAVQMGTAVAVLSSTVLGLAVSTSHCLVGAIIGIGVADRMCVTVALPSAPAELCILSCVRPLQVCTS